MQRLSRKIILIVFMVMTAQSLDSVVHAQDRLPVREFTNPDEMISLGGGTTFAQVFTILGGFSRQYSDKAIIDRSGKTGTIGFDLPNMHWRQALEYIANAHQLRIQEQGDFIEIHPAPVQQTTPTTTRQTAGQTTTPGQRTGQATDITATLDTREVEISAIFFEGNRRKLREIGVDWSAIKDGTVELRNFATSTVSLEAFTARMPTQNLVGGWEISGFMAALESLNMGEILASPSIKVMDGRQGNIQVGQDISIKQRDFAGNVTDAFYETGTILTVTPHIISERDTSFILLDIKAERSTGQPDPVSTVINKQEAVTRVLLHSGESTVIAGLYETENIETRRGIPILKDLPPWFLGLRYLFGYTSVEQVQKELVIVLKAEIVPSLRERFNLERPSDVDVLREGRERIRVPVQQ